MPKQQGLAVPHEERPTKKAMIWHGGLVPGSTTMPISKM